jgi:type IV pilus assembly protein PilM
MARAIALELSELDGKAVQVLHTKKGGVVLERAITVSFAGIDKAAADAPAQRAAALKAALKAARFSAGQGALVLPKQSATVRAVTLPSGDPDEIASMAHFEVEKFIPFNAERHVISHQVVSLDAVNGSVVLLAAVDQPVMDAPVQTAMGAGVEPVFIDVSSLALVRTLRASMGAEALSGTLAILHLGMLHTDITLMKDGEVVTTRSILHGVAQLLEELKAACGLERELTLDDLGKFSVVNPEEFVTSLGLVKPPTHVGSEETGFDIIHDEEGARRREEVAERVRSWLQKLVTKVRQTYEFALREYSIPSVEQILLTGEGAVLHSMEHALVLHLGVPSSVCNPLRGVARAAGAVVQETRLPSYVCAYGAAMAVATGVHDGGINLLPPALRSAQESAERRFQFMITGAMTLVLLVMGYLVYSGEKEFEAEKAELVTLYREEMKPILREARDKEKRINIIRSIRSEGTGALPLLEAIAQYTAIGPVPRGRITLSRFKFVKDSEVELEGLALEVEDVNNLVFFLRNLESDGRRVVESVELPSSATTMLPGRNQRVYNFTIRARLVSPGEGENPR